MTVPGDSAGPEPGPGAGPRPDAEVVFDPATYVAGVPFGALARLRQAGPVAWVPEIPVLGWDEGPGFWLVLRHAEVESCLLYTSPSPRDGLLSRMPSSA